MADLTAEELAAVVAAIMARRPSEKQENPYQRWRRTRLEALRRTR